MDPEQEAYGRNFNLRLKEDYASLVEQIARDRGCTYTEVFKIALHSYIANQEIHSIASQFQITRPAYTLSRKTPQNPATQEKAEILG